MTTEFRCGSDFFLHKKKRPKYVDTCIVTLCTVEQYYGLVQSQCSMQLFSANSRPLWWGPWWWSWWIVRTPFNTHSRRSRNWAGKVLFGYQQSWPFLLWNLWFELPLWHDEFFVAFILTLIFIRVFFIAEAFILICFMSLS